MPLTVINGGILIADFFTFLVVKVSTSIIIRNVKKFSGAFIADKIMTMNTVAIRVRVLRIDYRRYVATEVCHNYLIAIIGSIF